MCQRQNEFAEAFEALEAALRLAHADLKFADLDLETGPAPHTRPTRLPPGKAAIYAFYANDRWLKIGKAGPNTGPRYVYQHYKRGGANSTLASSLCNDPELEFKSFSNAEIGQWIIGNCGRINILMPREWGEAALGFLESFLILRLRPKYEGHAWR